MSPRAQFQPTSDPRFLASAAIQRCFPSSIAQLHGRWQIKDNRRSRGVILFRASGCIDEKGDFICRCTISRMQVPWDYCRDASLMDCFQQIFTSNMPWPWCHIHMSRWRSMHQQDVRIHRYLRPTFSKLLPTWQVEGPVAEFGLPGGAVDLVAANFNRAIFQISATFQQASSLTTIIASNCTTMKTLSSRGQVVVFLKGDVMISSNHHLFLCRISLQPLIETFNLL